MESQNSNSESRFIARLVYDYDYKKNVGQIACVSSDKIEFIKRTEFSTRPFEVIYLPMNGCTSIAYKKHFAAISTIFGGFCCLLFLFIIWGLFFSGLDIAPNTRIPAIGVFVLFPIFSIRLLLNPKRHLVVFVINGKKYTWKSKPGEFKTSLHSIKQVINFAIETGLMNPSSSPDATEIHSYA